VGDPRRDGDRNGAGSVHAPSTSFESTVESDFRR